MQKIKLVEGWCPVHEDYLELVVYYTIENVMPGYPNGKDMGLYPRYLKTPSKPPCFTPDRRCSKCPIYISAEAEWTPGDHSQ